MAKKNKFEKLGINERYFENAEEKQTDEKKPSDKYFPDAPKREKFKFRKSENKPEIKQKPEKQPVPHGIIKAHIPALCAAVLSFCVLMVSDSGFLSEFAADKRFALYALISALVYLVPCAVYCLARKLKPKNINVRGFSPSAIPVTVVSLLLLVALAALEKYYIAYNFAYRVSDAVPYGTGVLETVLSAALLPAAFETLFVNGLLQSEYSRYGGGITGIFASSLIFAALHFDIKLFVIYFTAGLVLGTLTHVSHSVFPAMFVHFLNNLAAIYLADGMTFIASERIGGTFLMTVIAVICFSLFLIQLQMIEKLCLSKSAKSTAKGSMSGEENDAEDTRDGEPSAALNYGDEIYFFSPHGHTPGRFLRLCAVPVILAVISAFVK